ANLLFENGWLGQISTYRSIEQFVIRNAAPQKKRQSRCQLDRADRIGMPGHGTFGVVLDPEQKIGIGKQPLECGLDAAVERPAFSAALIKSHQRRNIFLCGSPTERTAPERRKNTARTRRFLASARRIAHKDPRATCSTARALRIERTIHGNAVDGGVAVPHVVDGVSKPGRTGLEYAFWFGASIDECDPERMVAGFSVEFDFEIRVRR